ncbi:MAG: DNA polymerase III subunit gamma/tau [Deltaproteobacteria bacterium]
MSYLVLARKWRPQTFDDLVGQDYITQALKNSISSGKIAHALIFSGSRGVGKTTSARIVAKALNCVNGPTPSPCSECSFCADIAEGRSLDVMEIDAASHTGVADVREIIENVKYLPSSGKTKIYIIDEAHMLSQSAFNALLKTLEEPPPRVLFILATTESHKIPTTILSRCQRYEFKKVPLETIKKRLEFITSQEGVAISGATISLVAEEADGSMRDALSLMDRLIATFGAAINGEEAARILGVMDRSLTRAALSAVLTKNAKMAVEILNSAADKGVSPRRFSEDLLKAVRAALLMKICGAEAASDISQEERLELQKLSKQETAETLDALFNLTLEGAEQVHRSFYPRIALEALLVRLCLVRTIIPLDEIIAKIEAIQKQIPSPASALPPSANTSVSSLAEDKAQYEPAEKMIPSETRAAAEDGDFISFVKSKSPMAGIHLDKATSIRAESGILILEFGARSVHSDYAARNQENIGALAKEFFGEDLKPKVEILSAGADAAGDYVSPGEQKAKRRGDAERDPVIQNALGIFAGRVVKITNK